jgi:hypothetical protein
VSENSPLLPALKSSRLGFGVATVALVALATGTTGVLVAHGTKQLQPPATTAAPPVQLPGRTPPVVVDRAPGSLAPRPAQLPQPAQVPEQPVVAPPALSPAPPVEPPVVAPPVAPPVEGPPVEPPTVVVPPEVEPPFVAPDLDTHGRSWLSHGGPTADPHGKKPHQNNGKHLGQVKHGR